MIAAALSVTHQHLLSVLRADRRCTRRDEGRPEETDNACEVVPVPIVDGTNRSRTQSRIVRICKPEDGLGGPLREFAGIVLQLSRKNGTSLLIDLLAPVHSISVLGVPFVERVHCYVLVFSSLASPAVKFTTGNDINIPEGKFTVAIGN